MSDARVLISAAEQLRAARTPYLLATVVRVSGSSYRRPGARMIATESARIAGSLSGGCLDGEVMRTGWWRTRSGPVVVRYDSSDEDSPGAQLGCGGVVDVLLERGTAGSDDDPFATVAEVLVSEKRTALATVFESTCAGLPAGTRWTPGRGPRGVLGERVLADLAALGDTTRAAPRRYEDGGEHIDVLVEPIIPPPHLFVLGAGFDAVPVVEQARRLGWRITVCDSLSRVTSRERFAAADAVVGADLDGVRALIDRSERAVAVVMAHDTARDARAIAMLLGSSVRYIGVLGPRHRTADLLPPGATGDFRLHTPVGLDLGGETPEEIALAITAEILASLNRATAEPLRQRAYIHGA
jgi:xanthine dehydrogenase accessory factor